MEIEIRPQDFSPHLMQPGRHNVAMHLTVPSEGVQWVSMSQLFGGVHVIIYGMGIPELRAVAAAITAHVDAYTAATPAEVAV